VGLAPLGFLLAGPLSAFLGVRGALVAMGLTGCVVVLALALVPGVRAAEERGPLRDLPPDEIPPPTPVGEAPGLEVPYPLPADRP
jgi:hypothetical protein